MSSGVNTFEEMLKQLQEIVTRLESGNLSLSETLDLYEEGIHIAGACQQILDQAELRVTTLNNTVV
jgi:exodeoxyribonuclease VII small subunit